jgi:hypothetical protein
MSYIDESQAKGLVKRIFRSLHAAAGNSTPQSFEYSQRKICKKIKLMCKEKSNAVFIAERFMNTNKWQLIWGEWCLFNAKKELFAMSDIEQYDQIAFDLTINVKGGVSFKSFYVVLSKHALVRLIMRSQHHLKNPHDLNLYLKRITKTLLLSALELSDQYTKSNGEISQDCTVVDDVFLPLALDIGINSQGRLAKTCTIKTFMPTHYDGAVAELSRRKPIASKPDFFDYADNFGILSA